MDDTREYEAQRNSWILGKHYTKGDKVRITERQARVFVREGALTEPKAKK